MTPLTTRDNARAKAAAFQEQHENYTALGYHCLPIHPDQKRPAECTWGAWHGLADWPRFADTAPDDKTRQRWAAMPGAGIGIALGSPAGTDESGAPVVVVGIDDDRTGTEEDRAALTAAISTILPGAPFKVGAKGGTWLARMRQEEAGSGDYSGPDGAVQLLGRGRQTVLPPSIHPETGQPYVWKAGLVPASALPLVRLAEFNAQMAAHGYRRGAAKIESDPTRYDATAAEIAAGSVRDGLVAMIETSGGDLSEVWERGAEAVVMQRTTASGKDRDRTGNGRRLQLAREMRKTGFNGAEFRAAAWEWEHAEGEHVVTERDLVRAWADSSPPAGTADGFGPVEDDDDNALMESVGADRDRNRLVFMADEPLEGGAGELFKDLVPWGELGMFYGESGAGKSYVMMAFARAVATGGDFMGFENVTGEPAGVLIIAAEANEDVRKRRKALVVEGMAPGAPLITVALSDHHRLGEAIKEAAPRLAAMGAVQRVVLIDTFGQFFGMKNENDNAEMGTLIRDVLRDARRYGVMIVPIHHPAQGGKEPRGASALKNALDWACLIEGGFDPETKRSKNQTVTLRKSKGGLAGMSFGFSVRKVAIGADATTGLEMKSGVAERSAIGPAATRTKLLPGHNDLLRVIREHGPGTKAEITGWMAAAGYGAKSTTVARHADQLQEMGVLVLMPGGKRFALPEQATGFSVVVDGDDLDPSTALTAFRPDGARPN